MSLAYKDDPPRLPPLLTFTDFLDWPGDGTDRRYELIDGVLRLMAPGSDTHNTIVSNINGLLWTHLRATRPGCRVVAGPGVQPKLRASWNFRIPDLGVTCSPNKSGEALMPDPLVLIEVLSPSNTNDTWDNVRAYATLPTVQEIVVVHSTRLKIELLRRKAGGDWPDDPTPIGADGQLELASLAVSWPLAEIYLNTHLLANPPAA